MPCAYPDGKPPAHGQKASAWVELVEHVGDRPNQNYGYLWVVSIWRSEIDQDPERLDSGVPLEILSAPKPSQGRFTPPSAALGVRDEQNRSVTSWVRAGQAFSVTIDVRNLRGAELGALL